jgi:hypothetical protein
LFCLVSLSLACLEFVFASFSLRFACFALRFASFRIFLFEAKKGHPRSTYPFYVEVVLYHLPFFHTVDHLDVLRGILHDYPVHAVCWKNVGKFAKKESLAEKFCHQFFQSVIGCYTIRISIRKRMGHNISNKGKTKRNLLFKPTSNKWSVSHLW